MNTLPKHNTTIKQFELPPEHAGLDILQLSHEACARVGHMFAATSLVASALLGNNEASVYIKKEDERAGASFKALGAMNAVAAHREQDVTNFVTGSAGSHWGGLVGAVEAQGGYAHGFAPTSIAPAKVAKSRSPQANLNIDSETVDEALLQAAAFSEQTGATFVHPFAEPLVIAGQSLLAWELLEQAPDMTHLVGPIGGGGMLPGVASVIKAYLPHVQVVGVQAERCSAYVDSLRTGQVETTANLDIRFGGIAVAQAHPLTLALGSRVIDQTLTIAADSIYRTIDQLFRDPAIGVLYEEAGAAGPAGAAYLASLACNQGAKIVAIGSGANPGPGTAARAAAQRYVCEEAVELAY